MKPLCDFCLHASTDVRRAPVHLVHPERRVPTLFDAYSNAICADCGAL